ncbi:hypothetical protein A2697_00580 [Candidatus Curtissbacteria bacterium RIFCSPHIGHO2_01_FULL_41_44]|nr:MAG: hypothetical protein A2697_00580 [Candidatus Curtissbacteria bacterium RIFCSPHIGHO2_01_FULL_41_44]OGD96718.1 MAG: hypothetical protein A3E71_01305 [Candidatus Curtissbacteria bacterium RIFCSPHIGHO2_12_FULL_42_33]OGE02412.1 MAG: hypothetical protein A3G16_05210 [Candidatus Curtissbacteria bacterium RIFCSPLOWO2_12_FULL_41_16]
MKTNKQNFNLTRLLTNSLIGRILNFFYKNTHSKLPAIVGDYCFVSNFEKIGSKKDFVLGIYKNSKGQKAFAKMWTANYKDFSYYSLKNEIQVTKILNSVIRKTRKILPEGLKRMNMPKLISSQEKRNYLIMLTEYIQGQEAMVLTNEKKIDVYFKTMEFVQFLGTKLTSKQKSFISKRTPFNFALLYPMLVAKAVISHPRASLYILMGIPTFLRCLPALFKEKKLVLNHRDLHFKNILITKNSDFVIDLQLCVLTHPIHDFTTTLRYRWKEDDFYLKLLKEIIRRHQGSEYFESLFKGLSINSATHGLTDKSFPKRKIDFHIDYLKYAINFKL